jgi:cytochrome P450
LRYYLVFNEVCLILIFFPESLRLYPPIKLLFRECTKPYRLDDGFTVEKGTLTAIPVYSLHTDPEYYDRPMEFIPDRFGPDSNIVPGTYMPFGDGPRICIGE